MLFEKEEYYKYINTMENINTTVYVIIIIISILIGIATGFITLIITIPIGILLANIYTFASKIKIQKMKWEIDIYQTITKKEVV